MGWVEGTSPSGAHEPKHPPPGVVARFVVLREGPVEERVRGTGVYHDLARDTRLIEGSTEPIHLLCRDELVGTTEQTENRAPIVGRQPYRRARSSGRWP